MFARTDRTIAIVEVAERTAVRWPRKQDLRAFELQVPTDLREAKAGLVEGRVESVYEDDCRSRGVAAKQVNKVLRLEDIRFKYNKVLVSVFLALPDRKTAA